MTQIFTTPPQPRQFFFFINSSVVRNILRKTLRSSQTMIDLQPKKLKQQIVKCLLNVFILYFTKLHDKYDSFPPYNEVFSSLYHVISITVKP